MDQMCQSDAMELYFLNGHCFYGEASVVKTPLFQGKDLLCDIFQFEEKNGVVELCFELKAAGALDTKRKIFSLYDEEIKIIVPCLMYHSRLTVDKNIGKFTLKRKRPFSVSSNMQ